MSRFWTKGKHPDTQEEVDIAYGWDSIPFFKEGYFFQVYSKDPGDIWEDPTGEGLILNAGFDHGLTKEEILALNKEWQSDIHLNLKLWENQM